MFSGDFMSEREVKEIEKISEDIIRFVRAIATEHWRDLKAFCRELGVLLATVNPKIRASDVEDLCTETLNLYFEEHPFT